MKILKKNWICVQFHDSEPWVHFNLSASDKQESKEDMKQNSARI